MSGEFVNLDVVEFPEITVDEMLSNGEILKPSVLRAYLGRAKDIFENAEGPNKEYRRKYSTQWLSYWIDFLDGIQNSECTGAYEFTQGSEILGTWEQINDIGENQDTAALAMGGGEGHEGHRHAVDFAIRGSIILNSRLLLLMGPESWITQKSRSRTFLPRTVIISMWAHYFEKYSPDARITMIPEPTHGEELDPYLDRLLNNRFAYFFANRGDLKKLSRGVKFDYDDAMLRALIQITQIDIPTTTLMVRKLFGGRQDEAGLLYQEFEEPSLRLTFHPDDSI